MNSRIVVIIFTLLAAQATSRHMALAEQALDKNPKESVQSTNKAKVEEPKPAAEKTTPKKTEAKKNEAPSQSVKKTDEKNASEEQKAEEKEWHEYLKQSQKFYGEGKLNESFNDLELALSTAERLKSDAGKAEAFLRLGEQYLYLKKYEKAKTLMEEGLKLKRKIPGFKSVTSANALDNLAQAYSRTGDLESANRFEQEALGTYESMHKTETHDYAIALSNHANTQRQLKQYKEAEQSFAKAVAAQQKLDGSKGDSEELAKILLNAGGLYCEMNKLDSAKRLIDRATKIIRSKYKPEHPMYLLSIKSERVYCKKLVESLLKKDPNKYRPEVAQAITRLASLYAEEDDLAQAAAAYKQAIEIQEKLSPEGSAELNKLKDDYSACLKKLTN